MSRRILVADDSSTIQKVIKIAFARYAVEIVEAGSFIEALAAVGRQTPAALIIDASLPGARGPADFAKLASDAGGAPVLLLVGTYESVDESALRQAGFQTFLKKPFESIELVALVDRLLGGALQTAAPATPPPPPNEGLSRGGSAPTPPPPPGARTSASAGGPVPPPPGAGAAGRRSVPPTPPPAAPGRAAQDAEGPVVPPLPGSGDRSKHTTVIHSGGYETLSGGEPSLDGSWQSGAPASGPRVDLGDDGLDSDLSSGAGLGMPPPILTDQTRRGRRAFEPGDETPPPPSRPHVPPPPLKLDDDEGDEDERGDEPPSRFAPRPGEDETTMGRIGMGRRAPAASPLPPIPPGTGFGSAGAGRGDDTDASGLDLSLGAADTGFRAPPPPVGRATVPPGTRPEDELAALRTLLEEQLPGLVRQAVEEYCERHFKSLAREVIASELRRLADEKARHLVDN